MPFFDRKPRSWDAYLAGFRASGLLMASGLVVFVILIGVVTIKTWPHAGDLLPGGGQDASLQSTAAQGPQALAQSSGPNLVRLLGARGSAGTSRGSDGAGGGNGLTQSENGGAIGDAPSQPGTGGGQPQGAQPPPSQSQQPSNAVSEVFSDTGNTVQGATTNLGNALGGSTSPGLGGVVGGLGQTLNNTLQGLAGKN
jgi:hypothetical protein